MMIILNHRALLVGFFNLFSGGSLLELHIQVIIQFLKQQMVIWIKWQSELKNSS